MTLKEKENYSKDYTHICPVCATKDEKEIFFDGKWHCKLCGVLTYSPEYAVEIRDLLRDPQSRSVFTAFVREQSRKTNLPVDISPHIIKQVLKNNGIIK